MAYTTVREILNWTEIRHGNLRSHYQSESEKSENDQKKLLLNYLAKKHKELQNTLLRVIKAQRKKVLNTWCMEYSLNPQQLTDRPQTFDADEISTDKIIDNYVSEKRLIIDLFDELSNQANIAPVKGLFKSVGEIEINELKQELVAINRFCDM